MTKTYTIRPLPYSNFTNREFESLMTDSRQVLTSFAKSYKDEAMYDDHLEVFDSKLEQFQAQLASVENKQTLSLAEVDKERDSALVGLFTLHRGFAKIKEPNLKAAHETLTPVLAKYKDITKHTNDVATAEIKSLLKTLKEEPYDATVTTLGLLPMLTAVATAQEDYDRAEALARAAKSSKEVGKTKQLRTELSRIYDLFMRYTELSRIYDLFMRYTAASAEAYPEKAHFAKLLKDLNTIRDSKRRLASPNKKTKPEQVPEVAG
ncbi:DUF6261 family protein [Streptococcus sp. FDAARGOS_146]|uniref:DUF6261 family protein n=1 Tax=Streptococcus sp. FDAARGOS_146 TaxID=1702171 RepID=UPI000735D36B|nr:DUF6261 family protein [Streptococcus sp. FDAARGOS_146]PNM84324.1 hypothetical protein AL506_007365 [Streptococcus sp. FDAARGOS_146]